MYSKDMKSKHSVLIGVGVLLLIVIVYSILSGAREVGDAINNDGAVMQQIDPPSATFQAGTAPLGENEVETGYLHEDGKRYYGGKEVVEDDGVIRMEFPIEDDGGPKIEDIRFKDGTDEPLELDEETKKKLDELYSEAEDE